jgi:hypothetical protein
MFVVNLTNSDGSRHSVACTPTGGCRSLACMFMLCCLTTALILWFYLPHICRDLHCGDDYYDDDDDDDNTYYSPQLSYYAGSHDDDYTSHSYYSSSSCSSKLASTCYITVTSPTSGESYAHGDEVLVEWESAGISENADDGRTYVDVYYCSSSDADTPCYSNSDCVYLGQWYDSDKRGTIQFRHTTGTLYICLEDDYYMSPYGYSGAFTMSEDRRRLVAASETPTESSTSTSTEGNSQDAPAEKTGLEGVL